MKLSKIPNGTWFLSAEISGLFRKTQTGDYKHKGQIRELTEVEAGNCTITHGPVGTELEWSARHLSARQP